ncbi:MAG: PQQ-like beta-propeller repeat protein [Thermoguttaceae bacterium]|nr:PQQ-like beta-propeller repeat protein [Thermoguttaceae bacterium]
MACRMLPWALGMVVLIFLGLVLPCNADSSDWPMLAHDPGRSGATSVEIRPPFVRKWYRLFIDEGLMAGVQPVVAGGAVYIGTLRGKLYAIEDSTGQDRWIFQAGGAILHSCAVAEGKVFFGAADGKIYAVDCSDGRLLWTVPTGAAIWNAPLVHENTVVIGSRDGKVYAVEAQSGRVRWTATTGGPILASPALDTSRRRVYVASEDMRVYAIDFGEGKILWQSEKLPGATFRGYHPVVAPDGAVMVTVAPVMSQDSINPILWDMVKEIFGDIASWRHTPEENARLRELNFRQLAQPETYPRQLEYLRKRLAAEPAYQTFFVLDPADGRQRFVAPIVYAESMNATGAPPVVAPDGRVIIKYQVLLRSRYEHYSPFLNVGYLDTRTGWITPIMDQSRTYGWHDSLLLVHDEQSQLVVAGRVLINTHQDNVNAMDLDTLKGYEFPFCTNIHEPAPGEATAIWACLLRNEPLPPGKEWLIRGTAVYGGGSSIDVPVVVAGDSFYYIPSHELNSSCALIAYRMDRTPGPNTPTQAALPRATPSELEKMRSLPWDWDILQSPRDWQFVKELGSPKGTRLSPDQEAAAKAAEIPDAELDRIIWNTAPPSSPVPAGGAGSSALRQRLASAVEELVGDRWQPLVFPAGKHPMEGYRIFCDPTETLLTLARAYPFVPKELQARIRRYVDQMRDPGQALSGPTGAAFVDPHAGKVRSLYDVPADRLWRVENDIVRTPLARLYPLWLWSTVTGDWSHVEKHWPTLRELVGQSPNPLEEDCRNGYVAGLIAYCRLARRIGDREAEVRGLATARRAMRERIALEFAHHLGGVLHLVPVQRQVFARWRHLTPEVAELCRRFAGDINRRLIERYVDYHRPTWWLAWNVELAWRNESPFSLPTMAHEVFAAKAMIAQEPAEKLQTYLDIPWCKADLYFIQKLVWCIEAEETATGK